MLSKFCSLDLAGLSASHNSFLLLPYCQLFSQYLRDEFDSGRNNLEMQKWRKAKLLSA